MTQTQSKELTPELKRIYEVLFQHTCYNPNISFDKVAIVVDGINSDNVQFTITKQNPGYYKIKILEVYSKEIIGTIACRNLIPGMLAAEALAVNSFMLPKTPLEP